MMKILKRLPKWPRRHRAIKYPASLRGVWFAGAIVLLVGLAWSAVHSRAQATKRVMTLEQLGEALFFDTSLSLHRTQACASCHSPDHAFTDPRNVDSAGGAVSVGDDGRSLGDRNAPTAAYARFSPPFRITESGKPVGGQFHDGRAATLEDQAAGPPLNPIEMGMPSKAAVVSRLKENADYLKAFDALFGKGALDEAEAGYAAMTRAIAAFERTEAFAPFDSKYDRYLRGEVTLTDEEELGRVLFFSSQFTNCSQCHKLRQFGGASDETFTNYEYHNIGVPPNRAARAVNGVAPDHVDHGLLDHPGIDNAAHDGKYKVPTLRNVAVTAPYMHNGVFRDLRTVILFYDKYNSRSPKRQINPETGAAWAAPEVQANISMKELELGPPLKENRIDALVAFLRTLTDKRYEPLLDKR